MKETMRRLLSVMLAMTMVVGLLNGHCVQAESTMCDDTYDGTNVGAQDYSKWSSPIESYLVANSDGSIMRVQYGENIKGLFVEYYDKDYKLTDSKIVPEELPIFGEFYVNGSNYYVVTGQLNTEESKTKEVVRITKYDKDWKKIKSAALKDCNTIKPFEAGSCRMDASGDYLVIRSSHGMYKDEGVSHQANMTIQVNMSTMEVTDSLTKMLNNDYGYVTHSFNQFIKIEDNRIVAVDHADTYPRSIVVTKYKTDISKGSFVPTPTTKCNVIEALKFEGTPGDNTTGASVGGFELSATKYLIVGNTVVQDDKYDKRKTRNVFVTAVDKSTSAITTNFLTSYDEGLETTTTPQLVKISDTKFMVLWTSGENVYYTFVDENGNKTEDTHSFKGKLSDCVPVLSNGKVVWYTWLNNVITFYDINVNDLSDYNTTVITNGHDYQVTGNGKDTVDLKCDKCGKQVTEKTATLGDIWWKLEGSNTKSTGLDKEQTLGQVINCTIEYAPADANREMEVISSDESVVAVEMTDYTRAKVTMKGIGTATITVRPKYNPSNEREYTVTVAGHRYENYVSDGSETHSGKCEICGETITKQHTWNIAGEKVVSDKLVTTYQCSVCGETKETSQTIVPVIPGDDEQGDSEQGNNGQGNNGQNNGEHGNGGHGNGGQSSNGQNNGGHGNSSSDTLKKNISVKANGVTYKVTKAGKSGVAEVGVAKAGANVKSYIVPDYVVIDGIRCKVTSIAPKAFYKHKKLKKITIGRNITTIGSKAFYGCKKLKTITVNSTVLKKVGKKSIKGIKKNAKIKVPKKKRKTYKKLFGKKSGYKKTMKMK